MANKVTNILSISGNEQLVEKAFDFIKSGDELISFDKIEPEPDEIKHSNPLFLTDTQLKWREQRWGTKWEAGGFDNPVNWSREETGPLQFETAWNTPIPVIKKLSERFPELIFRVLYADQDAGWNCGSYACIAGDITEKSDLSGTLQGMELFFELNPGAEDMYRLETMKDGSQNYVYVDDPNEWTTPEEPNFNF